MGENYYTDFTDYDGRVKYLILNDTPTSLEEVWIRLTTEVPQGLTYVDPAVFADKTKEVYVDNR